MHGKKRKITALFLMAGIMAGCGAKNSDVGKTEKTEVITVWNYYNGPQKDAFDALVQEFNETEGKEKKIIVEAVSMGTLDALNKEISDSVEGKVGTAKLPQLASAYPDTAFALDKKGLLSDIKQYLTEEEQDAYVEAYLKEGQFSDDGSIKILPTAKATETFTLNMTAWQPFAEETGAELSELSTWEGVARTAEKYYQWTDAKTPEPEDGKAFFGRDAISNYMLVGSNQLGHEVLKIKKKETILDFDEEAMRKLWECYYLPYVKGYYIEEGRFRSDDLKMGNLISYVGSISGALYTPEKVIYEDGSSEDVECKILPVPNFENTEPSVVQQGGGMVLFQGEKETEAASVEFLKWFTKAEANAKFCIESGYLPVSKEANSMEFLESTMEKTGVEIPKVLELNLVTGMEEVNEYNLYTAQPFAGGNDARAILGETITRYAKTDRETIKQMLQEGLSLEKAVEGLNPEARFYEWYQETYEALEELGV